MADGGGMQVFIEDVTDELGAGATESKPVSWSTMKIEGNLPPARGGHSATLLGNRIIIWGGADREQRYQPDVFALDLSTSRWEKLEGKGKPPDPRSGHSAVAWGEDSIVIYGGMSTEACGVPALKRNSHTSTVISTGPHAGCMIVLGGGFEDGLKFSVQLADLKGLPGRVTWSNIDNESLRKLGGREMHAACAVGNKLLLFGGRAGTGETVSDELVTVDTDSMLLLSADKTGEARCGHAMAARGEGEGASSVLVVGGIDMTGPFAYDDLLCFELVSQKATVEEDEGSAGGGGGGKKSYSAEAFDLSWAKHKPAEEGGGEVSRFAHSATVHGDSLYVIGGINFEQDFSSVAVCSLAGPW